MNTRHELVCAARNGELQKGNEINTAGLCYTNGWEGGYVLLLDAIKCKQTEIAKQLLLNGARVNSTQKRNEKPASTPLHLAVRCGDIEIVKMLLDRNSEVNVRDEWNRTPLDYAVEANQVECVELLLNRGAYVNVYDNEGKTPLHAAAMKNYFAIVEILLKHNAYINSKASKRRHNGYTPLHYAVERGSREIVKLFLSNHCDVNTKASNGIAPLHIAIENKNLQIAEDLLQNGVDINTNNTIFSRGRRCFSKGDTFLHIAVKKKRDEDIVKLLINYRADVNAKNTTGRTPIFYALESLDLKFVRLLLNNGANIKNSPPNLLYNAVMKECLEIVDIILQHDSCININAGDKEGRTALHFTAFGDHVWHSNPDHSTLLFPNAKGVNIKIKVKIAKLLLSKGANVNKRTRNGTTPLHAAVEKGYEKLVETLLEYNADVNTVDKRGTMPIHSAAKHGNVAIMRMLINKVANINAKDEDGYSALHIATVNSHEKLVEILLKCGADYDSRTKENMTPLHFAAQMGYSKNFVKVLKFNTNIDETGRIYRTLPQIIREEHTDNYIVMALLENGADINIMNDLGLSPLDLAKSSPGIFDDWDYYDHKQNRTCKVLVRHIVKLKAQNLFVNENYSQSIASSRDLADFYTGCESEVIEMKNKKIGNTNVTFYDILTKDINQLAVYARNEDVLHVIESRVYQEVFPRFANIIHNQFSKGQERQRLLNSSVKYFNLLCGYELPELFTNQLFRYLSNMDLENLIEAYPNYNNISDEDHL